MTLCKEFQHKNWKIFFLKLGEDKHGKESLNFLDRRGWSKM